MSTMKKLIGIGGGIVVAVAMVACSGNGAQQQEEQASGPPEPVAQEQSDTSNQQQQEVQQQITQQQEAQQTEEATVPEPLEPEQQQAQEQVEHTSVVLTPLSEFYEHPNGNRFQTIVSQNKFDDSFETLLVVEGDRGVRSYSDHVVMAVRCLKSGLSVAFFNLPFTSDKYKVTTRFDSQSPYIAHWIAEDDGDWAGVRNHHTFLNKVKDHDELVIRFEGYRDEVTATFDLRGMFETPVQPNLDKCGTY